MPSGQGSASDLLLQTSSQSSPIPRRGTLASSDAASHPPPDPIISIVDLPECVLLRLQRARAGTSLSTELATAESVADAAAHHHDAVGHPDELLNLRGNKEDRRASGDHLVDDL
jgi:hypothetical protein